MSLIRRLNAARDFPLHTCAASRHAEQMARELMAGKEGQPL